MVFVIAAQTKTGSDLLSYLNDKADVICPSDSSNKERLDLCKYLYTLGEEK